MLKIFLKLILYFNFCNFSISDIYLEFKNILKLFLEQHCENKCIYVCQLAVLFVFFTICKITFEHDVEFLIPEGMVEDIISDYIRVLNRIW